jgi:hypothetical protein
MALTSTEEAQLRELIAQQAALLTLAGSETTIMSKLGATKVTLSGLPAASSLGDSDLLLVRQGTVDKSSTLALIKAAYTPGSASTTAQGIVELATATETQTGTDTTRAVTPAGLAALTATDTRAGLVELATSAEAQGYSDTGRALTPATLAAALGGANVSLTANGYIKLPGGLILQWGLYNGGATTGTITFPVAFPTACFGVLGTSQNASSQSLNISTVPTASNFAFAKANGTNFHWFALGN